MTTTGAPPAAKMPWLTVVVPMVWGTTYAITSELLPPDRPLLAGTLRARVLGLLGVSLLVLDGGARLDRVGVVAALIGAASMSTGRTLVQRWGATLRRSPQHDGPHS